MNLNFTKILHQMRSKSPNSASPINYTPTKNMLLSAKTEILNFLKKKIQGIYKSGSNDIKYSATIPLFKRKKFLIALFSLIFISIPIAFISLQSAKKAVAAWFDDSWAYRQTVPITNAGTAQTDYQIAITLDTATLITAGKMQSDCDDIRITDNSGKLLPHFIDTGASGCNTSTTNIWTKVPSIPTSGATIYLYYGNPSASNTQNGSQVFIEHDLTTFSETDPNSHLTINSSRQLTTTNMSSNEDAYVYKQISARNTGTLDVDVIRTSGDSKVTCVGASTQLDDCLGATNGAWMIWRWGTSFQGFDGADNHTSNIASMTQDGATTYYLTIKYNGTNAIFNVYSNPARTTLLGSQSLAYSSSFTYLYATSSYNDGSGATINDTIRNFHLRTYAATEPTIGSPTNEEQSQGPTAYWKFDEGYGTTTNNSATNTTLTGSISGPTWASEDQCINGKCLNYSATAAQTNSISNNITAGWAANNDFTLSMWFNCKGEGYSSNPAHTYLAGLFLHGTSAENGSGGFYLRQLSTSCASVQFSVSTTTLQNAISASLSSGQNKWSHLVAVKSGDTLSFYENGVQKTSQTFAGANWFVNVNQSTQIGSVHGRSIKGLIDDVKIYPYARTPEQIKSDYTSKGSGSIKGTSVQMGSSSSNSDALSNGLVGYWKMDEVSSNATDSSGNGNTLTNIGTTTFTAGKFGNAANLNGSSQCFSIADNSTISPTSAVTISSWIYTSQASYGSWTIVGKDQSFQNQTVSTNKIQNSIYQSSWTENTTTTSPLTTGQWNHVVITYDGAKQKTYSNGSLIQEWNLSGSINDSATSLYVGCWGASSEWFNGKIDELRIYNRALYPAEVQDLYNYAPGPVGYWNMDEGTEGYAQDISGNTNTGTWNGTGTHWTTGKFGKGGNFNGNNDRVGVLYSSILAPTSGVTFEAWAYKSNWTSAESSRIVSKTESGGYTLLFNNSVMYAYVYRNSAYAIPSVSTSSLSAGWHHFAGSYDGRYTKIYVDGVLKNTDDAGANYLITYAVSNALFIGAEADGNNDQTPAGEYFNGKIDDIKIYNYARTPGQIVQDMNAGHPLGGSPVGSQIVYYKFDEGYGDTGNNNGNGGSTINGNLAGSGGSCPGAATCPTWSQNGKFGKALSFDGSNDYVDISSSNFDFAGKDFTISLWAYYNGYNNQGSAWNCLIGRDNPFITTGYGICTSSSNTAQFIAGNVILDSGLNIVNGWHHIVAVHDSVTPQLRIYVDGVKKTRTYANELTSITSTLMAIGRESLSIRYANSIIDEVKIYNTALTADEVLLDYNHGSAMVLGSLSDTSQLTGGSIASSSASAAYCVPGSSEPCSAPVGEWKFDEKTGPTANDTSGNGNSGTITNATWTTGKIGAALNFDGNGDYVNAGNNSSLEITDEKTIEFWMWPKTQLADWRRPLSRGGYANKGYTIYTGTVGVNILYPSFGSDVGWSGSFAPSIPYTINQWNHIAITVKLGSSGKSYINGKYLGSITPATYYSGSTGNFIIGNEGGSYFNGKIDDVKIYNYVRTPAQIAWDYNRGAPIGHWKLDECQGTIANDASGNGNNGTITAGDTSGSNDYVGTCTGSTGDMWKDGATGKYNSSLEFDGTDDLINFGTNLNTTITNSNQVSFSAWIKPVEKAATQIIGWGYLNGIWIDASKNLVMEINVDSTRRGASPRYTFPSWDTWYHVVGIGNALSGYTKLYVNGNEVGTVSYTPGVITSLSGNLNIASGYGYFSGQIDDVRIYNYALTPTQIKTLFNENSSVRFGPLTGTP